MQRLSQRDERWASVKLGKSPLTVGRFGCTITSICMLHSGFYGQEYIRPDQAAKTFSFTRSGLIQWGETNFPGMKFVKRGYGFHYADIKEFASKPNCGVIVEVENGTHWCAVHSWNSWFSRPTLIDPWTSKVLWNWKKTYRNITGYALFKKDE